MNTPTVIFAGLQGILEPAGYLLDEVEDVVAWAGKNPSGALMVAIRGGEGVGVVNDIAQKVPSVDVIVLVDKVDEDLVAECIHAGAAAYVSMSWDPPEFGLALSAAARGMALIPRSLVERLTQQRLAGPRRLPISDLQQAWLRELADGKTVAQLAIDVGHSEREMYRRLGDVYTRMGVNGRTDALVLAARWGILEGPELASP